MKSPELTVSRAHRFFAYSYVALDERNEAKASFREALKVDPDPTLDPVNVSPKFIEVFQEISEGGSAGSN